MSFQSLFSELLSPLLEPLLAAVQRIFITADPVLQTHFPIQNTKTFPDDFDLSIDAVLPTAATTVTLYGQTASAAHYIKVLSTGFTSINIDSSIVTSTVTATKDSKQRRYGVKLVGNDFIFTEDGATIDTVTDAVAAAKSLIINVIAQSNGADFFQGALSDPILTDLTTPSNSESWQLNRLTANTEESSSGTNLLTYVNIDAAARELFTFNQSDTPAGWDGGVERWTFGDRVSTGAEGLFMTVGASQAPLTAGLCYKWSFVASGFTAGEMRLRFSSDVKATSADGVFSGVDTTTSSAERVRIGSDQANAGATFSNISTRRFIEIA